MRKLFIAMLIISSILLVTAAHTPPQLVTKSYLDYLLYTKISPINEQLVNIDTQFKTIKQQLNHLNSKQSLRVDVIIDNKTAYVDGTPQTLDVAPRIENDRTYVPVRFIGEAFGADFSWDEKNQKVTYSMGSNYIELFIGQNTAYINRKPVPLDSPPIIYADRTLVPFRFMGQSIGAQVEWNDQTRTATIIR
ncbi:MAG: copper amine oxidase N-terminal domain-containing protein [Peptococcales bacterium]